MAISFTFNPFTGNFDALSKLTLANVGSSPNAKGASVDSNEVLTLQPANTSFPGVLTAADWNTFNGKQAAGNYITALTGDGTASGPGSAALTLATVNSNVGSFGSSTSIPSFTVDAKGRITAASGNVVIAPAGTLTGTTLAANVVTSSLTAVGTIATGTWSATTIALNKGGTGQTTKTAAFDALSPMSASGDIVYGGTSGTGTRLAKGSDGDVLTLASGLPSWVSPGAASTYKLAAHLTFPHTSGGAWSRNNAAMGDFPTNATAPGPTLVFDCGVSGTWSTADTDLPQISVTSMPATTMIKVTAIVPISNRGGGSTVQALRITDGTTNGAVAICLQDGADGGGIQTMVVTWTCPTGTYASGSHTWKLQGASSAQTIFIEIGNGTFGDLDWIVEGKF